MDTKCSYCSIPLSIDKGRYRRSKSKLFFCSRKHKDLAQRTSSGIPIQPKHYGRGHLQRICLSCNAVFFAERHSVESRGRGKYCSKECESSARKVKYCSDCNRDYAETKWTKGAICGSCKTRKRRYIHKVRAVLLLGGKCVSCGYQDDIAAFEFHHEGGKDFSISSKSNRSWSVLEPEVKKCVLLCSNCHRIKHTGVRDESFLKSVLDNSDCTEEVRDYVLSIVSL